MNNIIWTKEELIKIKKLILKRTGLFFNDNNTLEYNPLNEYKINSYQEELILGINELLNIKERSEIDRILTKYSKVEFDSNNKLHYGLISTLSKINKKIGFFGDYSTKIRSDIPNVTVLLSNVTKFSLYCKRELIVLCFIL